MPSYNKVILMGHLTRDPELRVTPSGLSICKIGLAINRVFTNATGEKQEEVCFVDVDAFGRQADTIARHLTKGRPVLVEGRLKLDRWTTREGDQRSKLCVVLEQFKFLGQAIEGQPLIGQPSMQRPPAPQPTAIPTEDGHPVETVNTAEEVLVNGEVPF